MNKFFLQLSLVLTFLAGSPLVVLADAGGGGDMAGYSNPFEERGWDGFDGFSREFDGPFFAFVHVMPNPDTGETFEVFQQIAGINDICILDNLTIRTRRKYPILLPTENKQGEQTLEEVGYDYLVSSTTNIERICEYANDVCGLQSKKKSQLEILRGLAMPEDLSKSPMGVFVKTTLGGGGVSRLMEGEVQASPAFGSSPVHVPNCSDLRQDLEYPEKF